MKGFLMSQRIHAAVNTKLVLTLSLVLLVGGLFWGNRLFGGKDEPVALLEEYELWCRECKDKIMIPAAEAKGRDQNEIGDILCPKCGTFSGSWGPPRRIGNMEAP